MTRTRIPAEVLTAAHERSKARSLQDWATADRLRAEIEAAGWTVVDRGTDFRLEPAKPPTVEAGGRTRYGSSADVPSVLDRAAEGSASIVMIATDWPDDLRRGLDAVARMRPVDAQVIVVADDPSEQQATGLEDVRDEVVWTSARLGHAAALNAGMRRARSDTVIVLDTSIEPTGDVVTPLVDALADPTVAVAGPFGVVSDDLRSFEAAPPGDVDAIEGYLLAFRRSDYRDRGPLDEHFRFYRNLDLWWSLVLRDAGPGARHRRAIAIGDVPLIRHEHRGWASVADADRTRLSKRNFYRLLDRFRGRDDLLTHGPR
ncbi:MAG TPA: glycosyltransferase [Candidatus Limnocylindrales bacterium]